MLKSNEDVGKNCEHWFQKSVSKLLATVQFHATQDLERRGVSL